MTGNPQIDPAKSVPEFQLVFAKSEKAIAGWPLFFHRAARCRNGEES
jgi:hypothetical protein